MKTMFYIDQECPFCIQGQIGFRLCSDGTTIVMVCSECEFVWKSPENTTLANAIDAHPPLFRIAELGTAIASPGRWATHDEIRARGWEQFIAGEASE